MSDVTALLSAEMNNRVSSFQKRPGLLQIIAPFYHDDGDMRKCLFHQEKSLALGS